MWVAPSPRRRMMRDIGQARLNLSSRHRGGE
jgi:hypothetical protein